MRFHRPDFCNGSISPFSATSANVGFGPHRDRLLDIAASRRRAIRVVAFDLGESSCLGRYGAAGIVCANASASNLQSR